MNQQPVRNRNSKNERRRVKRDQAKKQVRKRQTRETTAKGKEVIFQIVKTISHFFPDLWERINNMIDPRKKT